MEVAGTVHGANGGLFCSKHHGIVGRCSTKTCTRNGYGVTNRPKSGRQTGHRHGYRCCGNGDIGGGVIGQIHCCGIDIETVLGAITAICSHIDLKTRAWRGFGNRAARPDVGGPDRSGVVDFHFDFVGAHQAVDDQVNAGSHLTVVSRQ